MAEVGKFILEILGVGTVVSALLGMAAVLGKSQLAHWLNKDLAAYKAELDVAAESHKADLARLAAKHSAELELHKATAVQSRIHQLGLLKELHALCSKVPQLLAEIATEPDDARRVLIVDSFEPLVQRVYEIQFELNLYFEYSEVQPVTDYYKLCQHMSMERRPQTYESLVQMQQEIAKYLPAVHDFIKMQITRLSQLPM